MKNLETKTYSALELLDIMRKARELGVTSFEFDGMKATWAAATPAAPKVGPGPARVVKREHCEKCEAQLEQPAKGPLCLPCWKEENPRRQRAGRR